MLDELDKKLIEELQENGRESYTELARKLGVVEGTVRKRIKHLLSEQIIKIAAVPNLKKLGYSFMSIIGMQVRMSDLRKAANMLAKDPKVCHIAFVTGRYDLMALVVARSHEEISKFMETTISTTPSILRTESFVNLDIIKGEWSGTDTSQIIRDFDTTLARGK
jgi:Lrp/AsnC family transcriptional regulator for asnA, asnC and gidA